MSLAERYPSAARSELRSTLALPILGCVLAVGMLAAYGFLHLAEPAGWTALAGAAAALTFAAGLYRLREWARWGAFVVALALVVLAVADLVQAGLPRPWIQLVWRLAGGLYYVGLVAYLPSPAATRAFALARSRWEPRARKNREPEKES